MALTRKMLESMQLNEAQIQAIIDEHTNVTDSIRKERDSYKEQAERVTELDRQLSEERKKSEGLSDKDSEIERLKKEFEDYKLGIETEKSNQTKKSLYESLLRENNVAEKTIGSILKMVNVDDIELDENGAIKNRDSLTARIKQDYEGFIVTKGTEVSQPKTPPTNGSQAKSYSYDDLAKLSQSEFDEYYKTHNPKN